MTGKIERQRGLGEVFQCFGRLDGLGTGALGEVALEALEHELIGRDCFPQRLDLRLELLHFGVGFVTQGLGFRTILAHTSDILLGGFVFKFSRLHSTDHFGNLHLKVMLY